MGANSNNNSKSGGEISLNGFVIWLRIPIGIYI